MPQNSSANSYADVIIDHVDWVSYGLPKRRFLNTRYTIHIFKIVAQKSSGVRSDDFAGNSMELRHQLKAQLAQYGEHPIVKCNSVDF